MKTCFAAKYFLFRLFTLLLTSYFATPFCLAQNPPPPEIEPPSTRPQPLESPQKLPPLEDIFPTLPTPSLPETQPLPTLETFEVKQIQVQGSTVFTQAQLQEITAPFLNKSLSLPELQQVPLTIENYYLQQGYLTSGAYVSQIDIGAGILIIQVVEGEVEEIRVIGTKRLNANYIRSRLESATTTPLNQEKLLEALQLLRSDPLIDNVIAGLSESPRPGQSILDIQITEADSFHTEFSYNNQRSPSVGTNRLGLSFNEGNLLGFGDSLRLGYYHSEGSDSLDFSYELPINPRNGSISIAYGITSSNVIEDPFAILDIESDSRYYEITLQQPVKRSPTEEISLGLTASRQESESSLLGIPTPLSVGADDQGRVRVSALRFFQEWVNRGEREVVALRSQFNLGVGTFDTTINEGEPDSLFFSWRLQGQWLRLLAPDTLLIVKGNLQIADQALLSLEQFGIGGQNTVRGYRQDLLLADNAATLSGELRWPVLRVSDWDSVLQLTPFADFATVWNNSKNQGQRRELNNHSLASVGLGLRWQQGDNLAFSLAWGIPLISVDSSENTWQEQGWHFSVIYSPF
ncbi:MAG: ShlB/FhaC/HecB family hemolysin secretion/activation protein [Spirulinaceae cyanobacterium]